MALRPSFPRVGLPLPAGGGPAVPNEVGHVACVAPHHRLLGLRLGVGERGPKKKQTLTEVTCKLQLSTFLA